MGDTLRILVVVVAALLILAGLAAVHRKKAGFTPLVLLSLILGAAFGFILQLIFGTKSHVLVQALDWIGIVGNGYVSLLKMLVIPLIFLSLVGAFTQLEVKQNLKKITGVTLSVLLGTTAVASLLGFFSTVLFHLQGANFTGRAGKEALTAIQEHQGEIKGLTLPQQIVSFLPSNIFADFSGSRATSTIAVVIFALLVGFAYLSVRKSDPEHAAVFAKGIKALQLIINRLVRLVLALTPYGTFALITNTIAVNSLASIGHLGLFIAAVYTALILVLLVHTLILSAHRINPVLYYKKALPALLFAFSSRTSAGTLPLNVKIQTESLGVSPTVANFAASFGLTIGQNGCAGVYPTIVATIIAPTVGLDIFSWQFILMLVLIDVIASFGVAGVGGGALFTTLIVLGALNLPVATLGVLIAIDPIVDMGRTLVNVNDSILAGLITAKKTNQLDETILNDADAVHSI
ncbi:cation:dicarboxylate symporter family transporter [Streptococcus orisasini]|uniref:cation:dicarboxylate symporter family transporter n=1 Tax=Streptococcus orisasini TaxID=1080071 RepID=UPI0007104F20|nr:cation:dicarboxylase symporter family transporter [Streptococcus orisasini]